MPPFPPAALAETVRWGQYLGEEWQRDYPTVLHQHQLAPDGTLRWTADFARWLSDAPDEDGGRERTRQVMRRLRRIAPRAYEVCLRALIHGQSMGEITEWLNDRAQRNGIPLDPGRDQHYLEKDATAILMAGVSFARAHY